MYRGDRELLRLRRVGLGLSGAVKEGDERWVSEMNLKDQAFGKGAEEG